MSSKQNTIAYNSRDQLILRICKVKERGVTTVSFEGPVVNGICYNGTIVGPLEKVPSASHRIYDMGVWLL